VKSNLYTLVFAAVLGVISATLLTAVGELTKLPYERNRDADEKLSILLALDSTYSAGTDAATVLDDFKTMIPKGSEQVGPLNLYTYSRDGAVQARAVKFEGPGLWGPIEGYLVLDPDWRTILALAITKQEETPGLGAEITSEAFLSQFRGTGKTIVGTDGSPGIKIVMAGGATGVNEVDGITGATGTSHALRDMINAVIADIVREAVNE
jgi:Na+-transporting NADH:ubiquinone oxidoreductase subunit C